MERAIIAAMLAAVVATTAPAQSTDELAGREARSFVTDLMAVGGQDDAEAMEAFLRERVDMARAFEMAFEPVRSIVTDGQRARLTELMIGVMAEEALMVTDLAQGGDFRLTGTRRAEDGIEVEGVFRDAAGDYPFNLLMGEGAPGGRAKVLDLGSPRASSVITKLRYATTTLALVTTDADRWIEAFEETGG